MKTNPHITAAVVIKGTEIVYKTNNWDVRLDQFHPIIKDKEKIYTNDLLDLNFELKDKEIIYTSDNWDITLDVERLILRKEGLDVNFYTWDERSSHFCHDGGKLIQVRDDEHSIIGYIDPLKYSYGSILDIQRALDSIHSEIKASTKELIVTLTPETLKFTERLMKKIESIMKKENVNELTIERQYFPEIFSDDYLEISKDDGLPTLMPFVTINIMLHGIMTKFYGNTIKFYKLNFSELQQKIIQAGGISATIGTVKSRIMRIPTGITLKGEIQSFLDWIKDSEGLTGYINYYLQQNNTQVISKLSKIYKELRQIFGIQ